MQLRSAVLLLMLIAATAEARHLFDVKDWSTMRALSRSLSAVSSRVGHVEESTDAAPFSEYCKLYSYSKYTRTESYEDFLAAIDAAQPGEMVELMPGEYHLAGGPTKAKSAKKAKTAFIGDHTNLRSPAEDATVFRKQGLPDQLITICGSRETVIDGGNTKEYGLRVAHSTHVRVAGFTLQHALKGLDVQNTSNSEFSFIKADKTLAEGIRLRYSSQFNVLKRLEISNTGLLDPAFGEGIYVGTSKKNTVLDGLPADSCSYNEILNSTFSKISAESIDVKEFSEDGKIIGNTFDGASNKGAEDGSAWVVVRGNRWLVYNNTGEELGGKGAGFIVGHEIPGQGQSNRFLGNTCFGIPKDSYCVYITPGALENVVGCDNQNLEGSGSGAVCNCEMPCARSGRAGNSRPVARTVSIPVMQGLETDDGDRPAWVDA